MSRLLFALAGVASALLMAADAGASPCTTTIMIPRVGATSVPFATLSQSGICVQDPGETFGNFNLRDLPAGGSVTFDPVASAGEDDDDITFNDAFVAGKTYQEFRHTVTSTGADIEGITDHPGLTKGATTALVAMATTPVDFPSNKQFTTVSSTTQIDYTPSILGLIVTETAMVGNTGHVSFVENTIPLKKIPEPTSLALLGSALAGLRLARRRRNPG